MPSHPASCLVYSPRSTLSRIEATIGAAARSPAVRPSALFNGRPVSTERIANSNSGRRPGRHDLAHRLVAVVHAHLARIHSLGRDADEGLRGEGLILLEGFERGLLAGGVAVEGEDDLAAVGRPGTQDHPRSRIGPVADEPADDLDVLGAEGGAARGDGRLDARELGRHDVRVPLDDDDSPLLGDGALGHVEPVEHLGLLIDRGLRRIEILRAVVLVRELARAKADRVAGDRHDRPHEAPAKAVVLAAVSLARQPRGGYFTFGESAAPQLFEQAVPRVRRISDLEALDRCGVEAALVEHPPPRLALGGGQLGHVEVHRDPVGVDEALARGPGVAAFAPPVVLVAKLHPGLSSEDLHRFDERHVLDSFDEGDDVASFAASETMPPADVRPDMERGRFLIVEGAQALLRVDAVGAQLDVLGNDVLNPRARTDLVDVLSPDQPCHATILSGPSDRTSDKLSKPPRQAMRAPRVGRRQAVRRQFRRKPHRRECHWRADWSVRLATWSTTARSLPDASPPAVFHCSRNCGSSRSGLPLSASTRS